MREASYFSQLVRPTSDGLPLRPPNALVRRWSLREFAQSMAERAESSMRPSGAASTPSVHELSQARAPSASWHSADLTGTSGRVPGQAPVFPAPPRSPTGAPIQTVAPAQSGVADARSMYVRDMTPPHLAPQTTATTSAPRADSAAPSPRESAPSLSAPDRSSVNLPRIDPLPEMPLDLPVRHRLPTATLEPLLPVRRPSPSRAPEQEQRATVHIGAIEITIASPGPERSPAPPNLPAARAAPAPSAPRAPLSRELTAVFGLRQS